MDNLFLQATREKFRFESPKGDLSVEQLWDLPLTSRTGFDLDTVAKTVNADLKASNEESFVNVNNNPAVSRLQAKLVLDWKPLKDQFGEDYTRDRDFKSAMIEDVAALKDIFPKLPLKLTERGLEMEAADASALSIPKRILTA